MEPAEFSRLHTERFRRTFADRFWGRVPPGSGCREWSGYRNDRNYGRLRREGVLVYAHRVAWELTYGPIPDGLWVLHHCDNPPCCEPAHLFLGTSDDNNKDRMRKGRNRTPVIGEAHHKAKLTETQVREIRSRYVRQARRGPNTTSALAREFGVDRMMIYNIVTRRNWKHVE